LEQEAALVKAAPVRVLLVEDDPTQIALISALLARNLGMESEIKIASRLSAALEHLAAGEFDIVLLDLSLPDSGGIGTFLKIHEAAPTIAIVVLTGTDDEELALDTMARGAQDYLVKGSVDGRLLVRSIRYSLYRVRSEEALNEQRQRLHLMMESIPDVRIYFKDEEGRFLEVNRALAKLHGFSDPQQVAGLTDYNLFTTEHANMAATDEREIIRTGQPILGKVEKETSREGKTTWALTTKMPFKRKTGGALGIFGISREITELKQTEEELRTALERLTRSHHELKETQMMLIQAEKLQSLGQMAASVAHEIKNPLAILQMGIDCLGDFHSSGGEEVNGIVLEMKNALRRADAVIRDMLDYSSARDLEMREVCVNSLIRQTLRFVRHELARSKVRAVTNLAEGLSPCLLDAPKIEQVLVNLFVNACHAQPDGGMLTITTSEKTVESDDTHHTGNGPGSARFPRGGRIVIVEIRDNGAGIPEDKLHKIFNPFFTTKASGNGTGLGLSVVRQIIDLHAGEISIANAEGGGARVMISLQCVSEPLCSPASDGN
jgi:PAS domain S-box-containing protein